MRTVLWCYLPRAVGSKGRRSRVLCLCSASCSGRGRRAERSHSERGRGWTVVEASLSSSRSSRYAFASLHTPHFKEGM